MSNFIKRMFKERGREKPILEKMPNFHELSMDYGVEELNTPKRLIAYTFQALWTMHTSGTAEDYKHLHKIAIKSLKRAVYEDFFDNLTHLELALYDHDIPKAKRIIQEIKEEVGL